MPDRRLPGFRIVLCIFSVHPGEPAARTVTVGRRALCVSITIGVPSVAGDAYLTLPGWQMPDGVMLTQKEINLIVIDFKLL